MLVNTQKTLQLLVGAGDDRADGGDGSDWVFGGSGNDTLNGNAGNDRMWAAYGADVVNGGASSDSLHAAADDSAVDALDCGESTDDRDRAVIRAGDTAVNCERLVILSD